MTTLPVDQRLLLAAVVAAVVLPTKTSTASFATGYSDGGSWNSVYAQGFSPSIDTVPATSLPAATPVELTGFQFFKSGNVDGASNIRLAILDGFFPDVSSLTVGMGPVLGVSTNVVASTAPLGVGEAIDFQFAGVPLDFGGDYGAVFVTEGPAGVLTPVLVSALTANYADDGTGVFRPESNYGTEDDFEYAVSNFINTNSFGQFFSPFSLGGDANFRATFTVVPEPTGSLLLVTAVGMVRIPARS